MNIMQQPEPDILYGTVPGAPHLDGKTFFGLHLCLAEDVAKISKVPGAPRNVYPARAMGYLVGIT